MVIDSVDAYIEAQGKLETLLNESDPTKAMAFADSLIVGPGQDSNVKHLRACTYVEAGTKIDRDGLIQKGIHVWKQMDLYNSATIYNLASAELRLWQLAVKQSDLGGAWLNQANHLYEARRLYECVAKDHTADVELRLKALTFSGNSYDIVGRYVEALDCYDRALIVDPSFGMALGNRGITLLRVAPLMGSHATHLLVQAAADLDAAIRDRERVLLCGGQSALDTFERRRSLMTVSEGTLQPTRNSSLPLGDPYLDWCLKYRLFLHSSANCISIKTEILDPISFGNITFPKGSNLDRINDVVDAFNTVKQDYITARYLLWLASADGSPIRDHARLVTRRTSFSDTYNYGRWGVRTGIAAQTLKGTFDLLDKIAAFIHLYFHTERQSRDVDFRSLPYVNRRDRKDFAQPFINALSNPEPNSGLMGLFDLSGDPAFKRLEPYRNAATHRFLMVHVMGAPDRTDWSEHIGWPTLMENTLELLGIVRGAILYLADVIRIRETPNQVKDPSASSAVWEGRHGS